MVTSLVEYKYQKYAKAVGEVNLRYDERYISKLNHNFEKEYIKAYIKLLSKLN